MTETEIMLHLKYQSQITAICDLLRGIVRAYPLDKMPPEMVEPFVIERSNQVFASLLEKLENTQPGAAARILDLSEKLRIVPPITGQPHQKD